MRNYGSEILGVLDEAFTVVKTQECMAFPEETVMRIKEQIEAYKPEVMFYGTFNSGKSTLLNAALSKKGKQIAAVSDAPCTYRVSSYPFGDYTVWDTPGIDAPEKDEIVSREHLKNCHVIVFVLSTGGDFDENRITDELLKLLDAGKTLIVVFNDKGGLGPDSPELAAVYQTLLRKLRDGTGDPEVERRLEILLVDAKAGFDGKIDDPDLWEASGVPEFTNVLEKNLRETTGSKLLLLPIETMEEELSQLLKELQVKIELPEMAWAETMRETTQRARIDFIDIIDVDVKAMAGQLINELVKAIKAEDNPNLAIQKVAKDYLARTQQCIEMRYERALDKLGSEMEITARELNLVSQDNNQTIDLIADIANDPLASQDFLSQVDVKQLAQLLRSKASADVIKQGLLQLRKLKVPGIKGRWETTLGKWSGKVANGLAYAVQAVIAIVQIIQAKKAQKQYEEQMRNREKEIKIASETLALDMQRDVLKQLPETSHELFGELETMFAKEVIESQTQQEDIQSAITTVARLQNSIKDIKFELHQ